MGGGPRINYPKNVWSPAGGWYPNPRNWKRNTAIAFAIVYGLGIPFMFSMERQTTAVRRDGTEVTGGTILKTF